jgi:hypothetical protein
MNLLRILFILSAVFINQQTINACAPAPLKTLLDSKAPISRVRFINMTTKPILLGDLELEHNQSATFVEQNIDNLSIRFPGLREHDITMRYADGLLIISMLEKERISPHRAISPYGDITPGFGEHTPTPDEDRVSPGFGEHTPAPDENRISPRSSTGMRRASSCPSLAATACYGQMIAGAVVTVRS